MGRLWIAVVLALLLSACASRPPMSRAEYMALTTREYPDITSEQMFAAAEAMFSFSVPGTQFMHNDSGMQAVQGGLGPSQVWTLNITKLATGVRLQVAATGPGAGGLAPVFLSGGGLGFAATSSGSVPVTGTADYDLFWARLDYMLGKRPEWMTCAEARDRLISGVVSGMAAFCSARLMDPKPDGPVIKPR